MKRLRIRLLALATVVFVFSGLAAAWADVATGPLDAVGPLGTGVLVVIGLVVAGIVIASILVLRRIARTGRSHPTSEAQIAPPEDEQAS